MDAIKECYAIADHWSTRKQILSVVADKMSFKEIKTWIPDLSRYRYNIARLHRLLHGRGAVDPISTSTSTYVEPEKLDHFLSVITSTHTVQDLPFGEKSLKLSSIAVIKVPNVIGSTIPEHIIEQYKGYCRESGFIVPQGLEEMCLSLEYQNPSKTSEIMGYFDRVDDHVTVSLHVLYTANQVSEGSQDRLTV